MIYIATHKEYNIPKMEGYIPIHVGAKGKQRIGYITDDRGDSISEKNPNFCELTGIYWIWKNCNDDYKGLVHYRRYFGKSNLSNDVKKAFSYDEMKVLLKNVDIVLPFVEHLLQPAGEEILIWCCTKEIFDKLEFIVKSKYPDYSQSFDCFFSGNNCTLFNMMFCRGEVFDSYCEWIFDILFELEKYVDLSVLNDYQKRLYGFLSERLLNVWVLKNKLKVRNVPVLQIEEPLWNRVNFIRRRFTNNLRFGIKYRR